MRSMNPAKFARMVRLLAAGDHAIPLDVQAYADENGLCGVVRQAADSYDPRELSDLLVLAGLDPQDVLAA